MVAEAAIAAPAEAAAGPEGPELQEAGDVVRLALPGGREVCASKAALTSRTAFFSPLAEESGEAAYGEAELLHLAGALSPGARQALPDVLEVVGSRGPPQWQRLFAREGLFHAFAAGHLIGSPELLDAARAWAAADTRRLAHALLALDCRADGASLRTCADYGLDRHSSLKLLHAAATVDAAGAAQVLVTEGDAPDLPAEPPVDVRDERGYTALHVCAVHDSAAVAATLIQASAAVDALCDPPGEGMDVDNEGDECVSNTDGTAMGQADVDMGRQPLRERAAKNGVKTALHLAALHDSPEVCQILLEAKADVAACVKGAEGAVTPLHECANADSGRAARVLAAAAAVVSQALMRQLIAAAQGQPLAEKAVDSSAAGDPEVLEDAGEAAKSAAEGADGSQGGDDVVQWARFLDPLNAKVGLNGSTPLHAAAENDAPGVAEALLEAKADMNAGDDQGDTPLHCAVLYGSPGTLAKLLACGANAMQENGSGELPLHLLAEFGPGDSEEMPPSMAKRHFMKSIKAQKVLIDGLRSSGLLERSLAHPASGDNGNTPLHAVARWNHLGAEKAARLLAEARADLEKRNAEGKAPLAVALRRYGREGRVVVLLRSLGAKEPPPEDVDPLAGALGGCVRPLVWPPPGNAGAPSPGMVAPEQPLPAGSPSGTPEPLLPLQATQATQDTQDTPMES